MGDDKDDAVKTALDEQKLQMSSLETSNLEFDIKQKYAGVLEQLKNYENIISEYENSKKMFEKKFKEQDKEIQDLKYELCKAEDDKDDAVKIALDEQKLQMSSLETSNLEAEIKQKYSEVLEQLKKYEQMIAEFENAKVMFEKKFEEQN